MTTKSSASEIVLIRFGCKSETLKISFSKCPATFKTPEKSVELTKIEAVFPFETKGNFLTEA
ncbi:hypothetical protein D3C86_2166320 [compost metagenome]